MNICNPNNIRIISETECLSQSLNTINTNFETLSSITCQLKQRVEDIRIERTFFYVPQNFIINSGSSPQPSDFTISTFVNSPNELDLGSISYPGDSAYVIYQNTVYQTTPIPTIGSANFITNRNFQAPSSTFERERPTQREVGARPRISTFSYHRTDTRGRLLDTPYIIPYQITNDRSSKLRAFYTVEWQVTNSRTANMPSGNYSFEFSLPPGGSINFRNRMTSWLTNNLGRTNVRIDGNITRGGWPSVTSRRIQVADINPNSVPSTSDVNIAFYPVFYVWKLTYENRPGRGLNYYINNGWPKAHRAQTLGDNNINWNRPETWAQYESW